MPSPNMPTLDTALVYPGQCLVEGTKLSEGRGTTRPFEIVGRAVPRRARVGGGAQPSAACRACGSGRCRSRRRSTSSRGKPCGGVQLHVTDAAAFRPYRTGVALIAAARELGARRSSAGAREPYEFVADPPAIDLLTGSADGAHARSTRARASTRSRRRSRRSSAEFAERRRPALIAGVRRLRSRRCASRCSAAASTRRTSRTSWSRSTCSRPRPSTSCGSCRPTNTRSASRWRRSRTGSRCASWRPRRSVRARRSATSNARSGAAAARCARSAACASCTPSTRFRW